MTTDDITPDDGRSKFKITLVRVLTVQVIALVLLWLLQIRYHV